jgi:UDP-glucose 4-epimerase
VGNELRVVVLGGTGFLGAALCQRLRAGGAEVIAVSHRVSADVDPRTWDIGDRHAAPRALARLKPHVVVNLAGAGVTRGSANQSVMRAVNAEGPAYLADAVARAGSPPYLIHAASSRELAADATGRDGDSYGASKAAGTAAVLATLKNGSIEGAILRIHNAYGPGQPPDRFVAWLVRRARDGELIKLNEPYQALDFVYVDDVAEALAQAATLRPEAREILDIGTGETFTVLQAAQLAVNGAGADQALISYRAEGSDYDRRPSISVDTRPARELLGWHAKTNFAAGLEALVRSPT